MGHEAVKSKLVNLKKKKNLQRRAAGGRKTAPKEVNIQKSVNGSSQGTQGNSGPTKSKALTSERIRNGRYGPKKASKDTTEQREAETSHRTASQKRLHQGAGKSKFCGKRRTLESGNDTDDEELSDSSIEEPNQAPRKIKKHAGVNSCTGKQSA